MHSKFSRLIATFAILICLPLQGLAAVTMPACQSHEQTMEMHVDSGQMASMDHCEHSIKPHDMQHSDKKAPCDKCFSCFLSSTQAIIPFNFSVEMNNHHAMYSGMFSDIPDSVLSSVYRPPRLTLA